MDPTMEAAPSAQGGPEESMEQPSSMPPEQAMMILKKFNIPPDAVPMVMAACEALESSQGAQGGGQPPQQSQSRQSLMQALSTPYKQG